MRNLPRHFKFQDKTLGEVAFIQEGPFTGYLFRKSRYDKEQWLCMRMANKQDLDKVSRTMAAYN